MLGEKRQGETEMIIAYGGLDALDDAGRGLAAGVGRWGSGVGRGATRLGGWRWGRWAREGH